jgi:hypothetical protein
MHDPVDIWFIVKLVHGEAVPVLYGAIAESKAYDFAKLHGLNRKNNFGYHNGCKPAQAAHGLFMWLEMVGAFGI